MVNGVTLEKRAEAFAEEAHKGQFRKYTNLPYVSHPQAVRDIVKSVPHSENMLAAALLHDVAEDCHVPIEEIECVFGKPVAALVASLTEPRPEGLNRAQRKAVYRNQLQSASPRAKTIKLADIIHNLSTIRDYDQAFAELYIAEKRLELEALVDGNSDLYARALELTK